MKSSISSLQSRDDHDDHQHFSSLIQQNDEHPTYVDASSHEILLYGYVLNEQNHLDHHLQYWSDYTQLQT